MPGLKPLHHVLIVGAGSIGERHIRCFLASGRVNVSIVEPNVELRATLAGRYAVVSHHASLDDALPGQFNCAVIATPAPSHVSIALRLLQAGVHVLIEKPLAIAEDGVDELERSVRQANLTAAVAYVYRAHPALADLRCAILAGKLGRVVQIVAVGGQHFPTYRPAYRSTYYASRQLGGGAVQDALTHLINAGEWLVGPVTRLVADADHCVLEGVDVEDTVHVVARHGDTMGTYSLNQHQHPNETTITVVGSRATARWELHNSRWLITERPGEAWQAQPSDPLDRNTLFTRQANSFLDAVEGRAAPLCPLADGVQTLKVNRAVLSSLESGQWQFISPTADHERQAHAGA